MNAPPTTNTQTDLTAPLALWRVAAAFMHILHVLFGAPEDVAARDTLRLAAHKLLASWLRAGEAMMRRLLIIEAAAYAKPNARPLLRAPHKRKRKLMSFTADAPEQWRVSFRCFLGPPASRRPAPAHAGETPAFHNKPAQLRSAWPLAERYEALLRVFNNPLPYARRLARQLYAAPQRLCELLRAHFEAEQRVDSFETLTTTATTRAVVFNST